MSVYKRGKIWWVKIQRDGQTVRRSSGSSLKRVAREFERKMKEDHARQHRGGKPRTDFNGMMERFVYEHMPNLKPQSKRRYMHSIKNLRVHFGELHLDEIDRAALSGFISTRRKVVTTATVRRDLACLSSAFDLAISWDYCDTNPVKAINKRVIPEAKPRTRYLTRDEFARLFAAAQPYMRPALQFAVSAGLRLEEQLGLTWDRVDIFRKEVKLEDTKTGTPRIVPLDAGALEVLHANPQRHNSRYVFCKADGSRYFKFTRGLAGAAKRAGIKDLRWHDLRRTFGSWKLQAGVDLFTVSRLLGHKSIATTERTYAFMDIESLRRMGTETGTGHADSKLEKD